MRLATILTADGTRAVRVDGDTAVEIDPARATSVSCWPSGLARRSRQPADGPRHGWPAVSTRSA